jgi:hypothetical protein
MLPNFNPYVVSSEPGQNLEYEAQGLLFPSRHNNDASEEEPEVNIGDEVANASLIDIIEGAAGAINLDLGLKGSDNGNTPDKVCDWAILSAFV